MGTVLFISPDDDTSGDLAGILEDVLASTEATRDWDLSHWKAPERLGEVMPQIMDRIKSADVIVAVITANNPNVLYELGVAKVLDKPIVLLVDAAYRADVAFDIGGLLHVLYELEEGQRSVAERNRARLKDSLAQHLEVAVKEEATKPPVRTGSWFLPLAEPVDLKELRSLDRVVLPALDGAFGTVNVLEEDNSGAPLRLSIKLDVDGRIFNYEIGSSNTSQPRVYWPPRMTGR